MKSAVVFLALMAPALAQSIRIAGPRAQIIHEKMLPAGDEDSINGPSLIRVPAWVKNPLGKYYLYFAHHTGKYIRMAYSDRLEGPWKIYSGGVLRLDQQKIVSGHIASPEAVIDEARQEIVLFYHGQIRNGAEKEGQKSSSAFSKDGLRFEPLGRVVGPAYLRVFRHGDAWYSLAGRGSIGRTADLHQPFTPVADVIGDEITETIKPRDLAGDRQEIAKGRERFSIRHVGWDIVGSRLIIYFTCVGHSPERILATTVEVAGPAETWKAKGVIEVMRPELEWEGAAKRAEHSFGGRSREWENSLRDPAVFREAGKAYLIYASAGEHGMGIARIEY